MNPVREAPVCLITGPTSGLGRGVALHLAGLGYRLALLGRNAEKLHALADECTALGAASTQCLVADMASQRQVRRAAERFLASGWPLHVLLNNAGVINRQRRVTEDGMEETMAISYWSTFLLTLLLTPRLTESAPAQIINTSSGVYPMGRIHFDDLDQENRYFFLKSYANTKTAVMIMTRSLARLLSDKAVRVNAYNPGMIHTNIATTGSGNSLFVRMADWLWGHFTASLEEGIHTPVNLIANPEPFWRGANNLLFWENTPKPVKAHINDDETARRLWHISETRTGVRWPFPEDRGRL